MRDGLLFWMVLGLRRVWCGGEMHGGVERGGWEVVMCVLRLDACWDYDGMRGGVVERFVRRLVAM